MPAVRPEPGLESSKYRVFDGITPPRAEEFPQPKTRRLRRKRLRTSRMTNDLALAAFWVSGLFM
jgi:hypothetical protein